MQIVVGHNNADMDCLASMMAATKLFPGAVPVFAGTLNRNVRDFLSLHKDVLNYKRANEIELHKVTKLIVVDTARAARIGLFKALLNRDDIGVFIYDHHVPSDDDIAIGIMKRRVYGAAVTIMIEELITKNIPVTPFEATVMALGLYEDTGCLTFAGTTEHDVQALLYLMQRGAQPSIVGEYVALSMQNEHRQLFSQFLSGARQFTFRGMHLLLATAILDEYVEELAPLAHKIGEIYDVDAVFLVIQMGKFVQLIARSYSNEVNVQKIMKALGGNGHDRAAAAIIKNATLDKVEPLLHSCLECGIKSPLTASDIMSTPVKTIVSSMPVKEAARVLLRCGHSGVPVVDNDHVVGVISRRDLDKAKHHGLGHAPVKGFMSRKVVSVLPDATLREIQEKMVTNDIGRVPVVLDGHLLGIVTRSDILRLIHGEWLTPAYKTLFQNEQAGNEKNSPNILGEKLMKSRWQPVLKAAVAISGELGVKVAVVGGFVRDILLGYDSEDLDITVEGDGVQFAVRLAAALNAVVKHISEFKTAKIVFADGSNVDIASARREFYEYPAALPIVEFASLQQDLARRDFTINSMAIDISPSSFGNLIDFFGGYRDLCEKKIRVLYNLSFIEDPTRLFRAVRFEQRYGFEMDMDTFHFFLKGLEECNWHDLSQERLGREFIYIFKEARSVHIINRMLQVGLWDKIFPDSMNPPFLIQMNEIQYASEIVAAHIPVRYPWLIVPMVLFWHLNKTDQAEFVAMLALTGDQQQLFSDIANYYRILETELSKTQLSSSEIWRIFKPLQAEILIFMMVMIENLQIKQYITRYVRELYQIRPYLNGNDIMRMGLKRGPVVGQLLEALQLAKLDGIISSKEEEIQYALQRVSELKQG